MDFAHRKTASEIWRETWFNCGHRSQSVEAQTICWDKHKHAQTYFPDQSSTQKQSCYSDSGTNYTDAVYL